MMPSLASLLAASFLKRTLSGQCESSLFLETLNCNPYHNLNQLPADSLILLLLVSICFPLICHESREIVVHGNFSIVALSLLVAFCWIPSISAMQIIFIYSICSIGTELELARERDLLVSRCLEQEARLELLRSYEKDGREQLLRNLIGNLAHDLKTPLMSFFANLELLSTTVKGLQELVAQRRTDTPSLCCASDNPPAPGEQRVRLKLEEDSLYSTMEQSLTEIVAHLRTMIVTNTYFFAVTNRFVEFNKTSNGIPLVPRLRSFPWRESIQHPLDCIDILQQRVPVQHRDLVLAKATEDAILCTDEEWLQENLLCLLSNAAKYALQGPVVLTTSAQLGEDGGRSLLFEVSDDEAAITPEDAEHFFDAWHSSASSSSRQQGGMGLGLHTLAERVLSLRGRYGIRVEPGGRGKTVWFALPLLPASRRSCESLPPDEENSSACSATHDSIYFDTLNFSLDSEHHGDDRALRSCPSRAIRHPGSLLGSRSHSSSEDQPSPRTSTSMSSPRFKPRISANTPVVNIPGGPSYSVLLVEDSPTVSKVLTAIFTRLGHRVTTAENGKLGLERLLETWEQLPPSVSSSSLPPSVSSSSLPLSVPQNELVSSSASTSARSARCAFDLVFFDFQMPIMDGLEATSRLRALEQELHELRGIARHQFIVGMTAASDSQIVQQGFSSGMDDFISKPFSPQQLQAFLAKWEEAVHTPNPHSNSRTPRWTETP
jgi:CheY-like chemotaxis protein/signal transduction histidine kinase